MKVIFLDNDGVICLSNNWGGRMKKWKKFSLKNPDVEFSDRPIDCRFDNFDKKAVAILNSILEKTGADIVVSSDWKLHANLEELGNYYTDQGIIKRPIDMTPELRDFDDHAASLFSWKGWLERARCLEIKKWIELNNPEKWVAIDDLNMSNEYLNPGLNNFVLTPRSSEGIKQSGISQKIINFLS